VPAIPTSEMFSKKGARKSAFFVESFDRYDAIDLMLFGKLPAASLVSARS
jgi:hypothetical protein